MERRWKNAIVALDELGAEHDRRERSGEADSVPITEPAEHGHMESQAGRETMCAGDEDESLRVGIIRHKGRVLIGHDDDTEVMTPAGRIIEAKMAQRCSLALSKTLERTLS